MKQTKFNNYVNGETYSMICKDDTVTVSKGEALQFNTLDELKKYQEETKNKIIFILPFCSVEREGVGESHGDEPILAMRVSSEQEMTKQELLQLLPDENISLGDIYSDISDENFGEKVEDIKKEIQIGEICQTIISRNFESNLENHNIDQYLSIYNKLLGVAGGYMTYMFQHGNKIFTAASPEVHLRVDENEVVKAPIAGTMPKGDINDFSERLSHFLQDKKEQNELAMVVDEELKMMMKICSGGKISKLQLREIAQVIHTEYELHGKPDGARHPLELLRNTLFSPTLVGGPIKSALEKIKQHENNSRRYYGSAFGYIDNDTLDTCIPIRAAEIDIQTGLVTVRSGAGIVSGSEAKSEIQETHKKAGGFFAAAKGELPEFQNYLDYRSDYDKQIHFQMMTSRDLYLSNFYFDRYKYQNLNVPEIKGKTVTIISNGDDFSYMLEYMLQQMGAKTDIIENNGQDFDIPNSDLVVLGPGYGDINNENDSRIKKLNQVTKNIDGTNQKILGICLGHQALCKNRNIPVTKQDKVTQGRQDKVDIFGKTEKLGFYNSFSPEADESSFDESIINKKGRVLYQKTGNTISSQFHPESIMSERGFEVLKKMLLKIM